MKNIFSSVSVLLMICSCSSLIGTKQVTHIDDYQKYLLPNTENSHLKKIDEEIGFWEKRFETSADDIVARSKIASLLNKRFSYSGNLQEVKQADSLYQLVNNLNRINSSSTFRALAATAITQHKFLLAQSYIDSALVLGDDKWQTQLMNFDVSMELGNTVKAKKILNSLSDKNTFEYLIREAKYKDHAQGDLDGAIDLMLKAWEKVKDGNNEDVKLWLISNLGDMYGHNNQFEKSYQCYLDVLKTNPQYYHALKGIAWLAFSKDHDVANAKKILLFLKEEHPVPDYDLLLSKISSYENNPNESEQYQKSFIESVSKVMYGDMYNKYLFILQADELNDASIALTIAEKETRNRPTAEAFSWLAWAYLKNGEKEKAIQTIKYHVENKCFEPEALYYMGKIYLANNDKTKAKMFLEEARNGGFELGPMIKNDIDATLKQL